jgi:hypothetical protein
LSVFVELVLRQMLRALIKSTARNLAPETLLDIALQYDKLAEHAERRRPRSDLGERRKTRR